MYSNKSKTNFNSIDDFLRTFKTDKYKLIGAGMQAEVYKLPNNQVMRVEMSFNPIDENKFNNTIELCKYADNNDFGPKIFNYGLIVLGNPHLAGVYGNYIIMEKIDGSFDKIIEGDYINILHDIELSDNYNFNKLNVDILSNHHELLTVLINFLYHVLVKKKFFHRDPMTKNIGLKKNNKFFKIYLIDFDGCKILSNNDINDKYYMYYNFCHNVDSIANSDNYSINFKKIITSVDIGTRVKFEHTILRKYHPENWALVNAVCINVNNNNIILLTDNGLLLFLPTNISEFTILIDNYCSGIFNKNMTFCIKPYYVQTIAQQNMLNKIYHDDIKQIKSLYNVKGGFYEKYIKYKTKYWRLNKQ